MLVRPTEKVSRTSATSGKNESRALLVHVVILSVRPYVWFIHLHYAKFRNIPWYTVKFHYDWISWFCPENLMPYVPGCCHIMKKVVLFHVAKNLMYHPRCSLCLNIQMFPCCPKMLSRDADLLVLRQLLVSLKKPSLNEEFLLFLVFSISAHSGPSPLLCLLLGFHGDQPKAMSTHLFVHNVFFFSLSSVLHVLPYKPVLERWKGFYSLENLFPLFFIWIATAASKIAKNSYCGWL